MRGYRLTIGISICLAAALGLALPLFLNAQATTTQLTAVEVFDPAGIFGGGSVGEFLNPGTVNCPGHQPTGNPMQPCPPGSLTMIRGLEVKTRYISQSPLLSGWVYLKGNSNFDADATGHVWGTFRIELDDGGAWIGSWNVHRSKVENVDLWIGRGSFVGRGRGGDVDGMQLRFTEILTSVMPVAIAYSGTIEALVLAPPPSQ